jgi:transcriptional regulator with GAF, ATPase, and Fis domain
MQRFRFLLDVWREVCQHLEIGESVERLMPLLEKHLPVSTLLVRHIDVAHSCVETVATGISNHEGAELRPRSPCQPQALERLLGWCRQGQVLRQGVAALNAELPSLLPAGLEGQVLAGPLSASEGHQGVLVMGNHFGAGFSPEHEDLIRDLLEPFTVAMENDRRVRELTSLREAVEADNRSLLSRLDRHDISDSIVGAETGLRAVMEQIDLVARSDVPALILGETGSGKEVVARAIHSRSPRAGKPFLRVNCGAIPPELVDSELFGHERGSFTGATGVRKGWFERADGGTLFLDECGELPLAAQVRLLRILQDGTFERVGGERQLTVDVRIVAATHRDLQRMVPEGRFREDLWYRISVFPIRLPPLRDRADDIPAMAAHFALRAAKRLGTLPLVPGPEDIRLLVAYAWPGNVRELAAVIERAAILGDGRTLEVARALGATPPQPIKPVEDSLEPPPPQRADVQSLNAAMAQHIEAVLVQTHGRIEGPYGAAKILGINPHTLRGRMRKLGVQWNKYRSTLSNGHDLLRDPKVSS